MRADVSAGLEALVQEGAVALANRVLVEAGWSEEGELTATNRGRLARVFNAAAEILTLNVIGPLADHLDKLGLADQIDITALQPLEPTLVDESSLHWHLAEVRVDYLLNMIPSRHSDNNTLMAHDLERFATVKAEVLAARARGERVSPELRADLESLYSFTARWAPLYRKDADAVAHMEQVFEEYANSEDAEIRRVYARSMALQTGFGTQAAKDDAAELISEQIAAFDEDIDTQADILDKLRKQRQALADRRELLL